MFHQLSLEDAARQSWDVVIAGSSFAAMFFLHGLPRELRVLIVETGDVLFRGPGSTEHDYPRQDVPMHNESGRPKLFLMHRLFGGNSNCWTGQVPRFQPSDFTLFEDTGRAAPWPIRYDDVAPFYAEVEAMMEIAGQDENSPSPRSSAYPFPAHTLARGDAVCVSERPDIWYPSPTARSNGGARPACCANHVCADCPIGAKFTVPNSLHLFERSGVSLVPQASVERLDLVQDRATAAEVRSRDGATHRLRAGVFALAANAVNNAAILLRSGLTFPSLGRYLNEQVGRQVELDISVPSSFGGTIITSLCHGFWTGAERASKAAVMIEQLNVGVPIRAEPGRWTDTMVLKLIAEDEPSAANIVHLGSDGETRITWTGHARYAYDGLDFAEANLARVLPFEIERVRSTNDTRSEYHVLGTHRMGTDPAQSVVDRTLRVHGVGNLFALGSGAFPTTSPANPTLTLSALSLMAGRSA